MVEKGHLSEFITLYFIPKHWVFGEVISQRLNGCLGQVNKMVSWVLTKKKCHHISITMTTPHR